MRLLALGGRARFRGLASLRARLPVVTSCLLRVPACARALGTTPHTPAPGAEISPRLITSHLTSADSLSAILEVYKCHGNSFDAINVATAWNRLGKARATDSERAGFFRQEERTLMQLLQHTERFIPRLDARGIAGASYGMARLGFGPAGATMRLLGAEAIPRLGEFKPQALANTARAFATLGMPAPQLFDAIARESEQRIGSFSPQDLISTAWAFAKLGVPAPQLIDAIARAQHVGGSTAVGGFAKVQVLANAKEGAAESCTPERKADQLLSPRLITSRLTKAESLSAILDVYKRNGSSFDEVNVATAWSRLGKMRATGRERPGFFQQEERTLLQLMQHTERVIPRLDARGITGACYGIAKLGFEPAAGTMGLLGAAAITRIGEFEPQGLANTAWAFATLGVPAPQLFDAIAHESEHRIGNFTPQGLANTAWAFAKLGEPALQLFEAIARESEQRVGNFEAQNLANTAWAFATLGMPAPQLFDAIARESEQRIGGFNAQGLANTAWAFAKLGLPAPQLFEAIARESTQRVGDFEAQGLANTAWAFAKLGAPAPQLFEAIARESAQRVGDFNAQGLANTAWAFATLGIPAPQLFDAIARESEQRIGSFEPQDLANIAWAFEKLGISAPRNFGNLTQSPTT